MAAHSIDSDTFVPTRRLREQNAYDYENKPKDFR